MPTCTCTPDIRGPRAGRLTWRATIAGPGSKASGSWAPVISLTPGGSRSWKTGSWRRTVCTRSGNRPRARPSKGLCPADHPVRFILTTEISSIYKKQGQVRKVHSLIGVPTLEDARRMSTKLATIGNIASDGRPILGLDPKDLLSLLLETSPDSFLIPAHIWTPWFSLFGSKSGFDRIEDCFEELTPHIFALETGLSSDPLMNWRWSALDRYRLISNSDAHSPGRLGREANLLDTEQSWQGLVDALRTGEGFLGTFEFYPEEGKYHYDGHRKCGVCMEPDQTLKTGGMCPVCGTPVTVGVLNRVLALADRAEPLPPRRAEGFSYIIPLPELLAEIAGSGSGSKAVTGLYGRIITAFGNEYGFLLDAALEDISRSQGSLLAEAVRRMREGRIDPRPGYDGEFGVIRVFNDAELIRLRGQDELFQAETRILVPEGARALPLQAARARAGYHGGPRDSRRRTDAPSLIAIPGAAWSWQVPAPGRPDSWWPGSPVRCAPGPSSRAGSLRSLLPTGRPESSKTGLRSCCPGQADKITAATFHSFCWSVLRERDPSLLAVYAPSQRAELLEMLLPAGDRSGEGRIRGVPQCRIRGVPRRPCGAHGAVLGRDGGTGNGPANRNGQVRGGAASHRRRGPLVPGDAAECRAAGRRSIPSRALRSIRSHCHRRAPGHQQAPVRASDAALPLRGAGAGHRGPRPGHLWLSRLRQGIVFPIRRADRRPHLLPDTQLSICRGHRSLCRRIDFHRARAQGAPLLAAVRPEGARVRLLRVSDPQEEGKIIAGSISDLVGGVDSVSVDAARGRELENVAEYGSTRSASTPYRDRGGYAFSDIAVLFRTRAVRDALLPSLAGAGLPLTLGAGTPLAEEEPFRSLVAALRLVVMPGRPGITAHPPRPRGRRKPRRVGGGLARSAEPSLRGRPARKVSALSLTMRGAAWCGSTPPHRTLCSEKKLCAISRRNTGRTSAVSSPVFPSAREKASGRGPRRRWLS